MAKNEFLPFGIAEGANVLSNQEYERLAARFNGFISGVAKSKELNTVWRQSSIISSAIAQFVVDSDNKDLLDNGDVAGIKNRLVAAIKQTISGVGYVTTAAMNLELNKKIDKASISGVLGNDNSKVPSLNLLTTELGKKQPAGNYQPAGDYATNAALNSGLNSKLNTSLTFSISSSDSVFWKGAHAFKTEIGIGDLGMKGKRMWILLSGVSLNPTGSESYHVFWPTKAGTLLTSSDITSVSGTSSSLVMNQNGVTNELAKKFDKTSIVHDVGSSTTDVISQGAVTNLLFGVAQGYFDVTDQRAVDTTYTNTTGRPIVVSIYTTKTMETSNSLIAVVNDIRIFDQVIGGGNTLTKNITASFIVPRNGKYRVSASVAIDKWVELR